MEQLVGSVTGTAFRPAVTIEKIDITVIEYGGQRVVTFAMIDRLHARVAGTASRNYRENRARFVENDDFINLNQPDEIRRLGFTRPQGGIPANITLVTRRGYLKLVKSLNDDVAWGVFDQMVDRYFAPAKPGALALDYSDPKVLIGVLGHLQAQVAEKNQIIAEQGEKVRQLDRIEGSVGSLAITDAAKTLKVGRDWLIRFMVARSWIYKRVGNSSWLARQERINSGYMEHKEHLYKDSHGEERVSTRALVTGKGLVKLSELISAPLH